MELKTNQRYLHRKMHLWLCLNNLLWYDIKAILPASFLHNRKIVFTRLDSATSTFVPAPDHGLHGSPFPVLMFLWFCLQGSLMDMLGNLIPHSYSMALHFCINQWTHKLPVITWEKCPVSYRSVTLRLQVDKSGHKNCMHFWVPLNNSEI